MIHLHIYEASVTLGTLGLLNLSLFLSWYWNNKKSLSSPSPHRNAPRVRKNRIYDDKICGWLFTAIKLYSFSCFCYWHYQSINIVDTMLPKKLFCICRYIFTVAFRHKAINVLHRRYRRRCLALKAKIAS